MRKKRIAIRFIQVALVGCLFLFGSGMTTTESKEVKNVYQEQYIMREVEFPSLQVTALEQQIAEVEKEKVALEEQNKVLEQEKAKLKKENKKLKKELR